MPDQFSHADDAAINLDVVRDELGRVPIIGPCSDRELFLDMPASGLAGRPASEYARPVEREFLSHDFSYGA